MFLDILNILANKGLFWLKSLWNLILSEYIITIKYNIIFKTLSKDKTEK